MEIVEKLYLKWCEFGGCKKFVTLAVTSVWRFLPMHGLSSSTRFFAWMFFYTFVTFFPHLFRDFVNTFAMDLSNCFTILSHFFLQFLSFLWPFAKGCRKPAKHIQKKVKVSSFYTLQLYCQFTLFFYTFFTIVFPIYTFCTFFFALVFPIHLFVTLFILARLTLFLQLYFQLTLFCYTFFLHFFYSCISNSHFFHTFLLHVFHTFFTPFLQLYFQFTLFFTLFLHFLYTFFVRKLQKKCKKSVKKV